MRVFVAASRTLHLAAISTESDYFQDDIDFNKNAIQHLLCFPILIFLVQVKKHWQSPCIVLGNTVKFPTFLVNHNFYPAVYLWELELSDNIWSISTMKFDATVKGSDWSISYVHFKNTVAPWIQCQFFSQDVYVENVMVLQTPEGSKAGINSVQCQAKEKGTQNQA